MVAAGAPWFMTLFGRDSLWASAMALPVDPSLALGTLQTLADRQGKVVDPLSEEEPGKILHEIRLDVSSGLSLGGKSNYYGSVDATPLFLMVLGAVSRWGFAAETIAALLPHADRALEWIMKYGDKDRDGFVEYERLNDQGLINQGWKDSWDGINLADGTLAISRPCRMKDWTPGAVRCDPRRRVLQLGQPADALARRTRAVGKQQRKGWAPQGVPTFLSWPCVRQKLTSLSGDRARDLPLRGWRDALVQVSQ